jgi:mono/diheme cytochrome c family protein
MRIHRGVAALGCAVVLLASLAAMRQQGQGQRGQAGTRLSEPSQTEARGKQVPLETNEDGQPRSLPALPSGMTMQMIRQGDSLFHSTAGCYTCHGMSGTGMPAAGSAITTGLGFIPIEWQAIDSLVTAGIPESITRTPIAMPPRGATSNMSPDQIRLVAAYVWAIANVQGEPWRPGGRERTRANAIGQQTAQSETSATDTTRRDSGSARP